MVQRYEMSFSMMMLLLLATALAFSLCVRLHFLSLFFIWTLAYNLIIANKSSAESWCQWKFLLRCMTSLASIEIQFVGIIVSKQEQNEDTVQASKPYLLHNFHCAFLAFSPCVCCLFVIYTVFAPVILLCSHLVLCVLFSLRLLSSSPSFGDFGKMFRSFAWNGNDSLKFYSISWDVNCLPYRFVWSWL